MHAGQIIKTNQDGIYFLILTDKAAPWILVQVSTYLQDTVYHQVPTGLVGTQIFPFETNIKLLQEFESSAPQITQGTRTWWPNKFYQVTQPLNTELEVIDELPRSVLIKFISQQEILVDIASVFLRYKNIAKGPQEEAHLVMQLLNQCARYVPDAPKQPETSETEIPNG